jgi:hypothetical protein
MLTAHMGFEKWEKDLPRTPPREGRADVDDPEVINMEEPPGITRRAEVG